MIISRTPYRISFFGGGTDYPSWYRNHGGAVLATTINKYCYLTCRYLPPFFEHRFRVVYSKIEDCQSVDEIQHPSVREVLRFMKITRGVEIHHDGDLPARSGIGSSSSFTVGLCHALHALQGRMPSKFQLATESMEIEQVRLKETVGSQDQILAAYGGLNHISFLKDGEFLVRPVTVTVARKEELNAHLMLFYTGIRRTASDVAKSYVGGLERKARQLSWMKECVTEALRVLCGRGDICDFGRLLKEAWQIKRSLGANVTNQAVDDLYQESLNAGALGGKLTGAGGGGFLLLFVPPGCQRKVRRRLQRLISVPFKFESSGSQIIFFDPEEDYSAIERHRDVRSHFRFQELSSLDPKNAK